MRAYVEHLCEHCAILRVGPVAEKLFDDFVYAITFVREGDYAVAKGFNRKKLDPSEYELIISAINKPPPEGMGLLVEYWRTGTPLRRVQQQDLRLTNGRIVMSVQKEPIRSPHEAITDRGVDNDIVISGAEHAIAQAKAGHIDFLKVGELAENKISLELQNAIGSLPAGARLMWFTMVDATPPEPAVAAAEAQVQETAPEEAAA